MGLSQDSIDAAPALKDRGFRLQKAVVLASSYSGHLVTAGRGEPCSDLPGRLSILVSLVTCIVALVTVDV